MRSLSPRSRRSVLGGALALTVLALAPLLAALKHVHAEPRAAGPRRVVLFIGDGMGVAHVTLGRLAAERSKRPYAFDRFPVIGLCDTHSANNVVTDSAAAATAISAGYKTNNTFLGVDPEKRPRSTILELARRAGMKTGLVTTARLTDATPAAFATHEADRHSEARIAEQYLDARVDVLLGGGGKYLTAERLAALSAQGCAVVTSAAAFREAKAEGRITGVFTPDNMSYELERDSAREPSLREMTEKALDALSRDGASFFLMVEGGRIDHAGHHHDAAALVGDQLAFADAIDAALERVERGGDLLVVVTADHTTGGLAISEKLDVDALLAARTSTEELVKRHAKGELGASLESLEEALRGSYGLSPTKEDLEYVRAGSDSYLHVRLAHLVSQRRGVGFYDVGFQQLGQPATHGHEGSLVPVFATGPGAETFAGIYQNTRLATELARLMGLPRPGEPIPDPGKRFY